jgi:flagellar assembly factor FliW
LKRTVSIEHSRDDMNGSTNVVYMDEGLIGFSQYRAFMFLESEDILPFRLMKSLAEPTVTFAVLEPTILVPGYLELIPGREWEVIGVNDRSKRLAFVIAPICETAKDTTANLQSPILVNYETMTARQVILTDSGLPTRYPLG